MRILVKKAGRKGFGVFAANNLNSGEIVVIGKLESVIKQRTDYSFQVDINKHVQLDKLARSINHSCDPNLGVKDNRFGGYDFIALRKIKKGEELTWDYCMTEFVSIAVEGSCLCGSNKCRVKIGGFVCLPLESRNKYNEFIADYLKRL